MNGALINTFFFISLLFCLKFNVFEYDKTTDINNSTRTSYEEMRLCIDFSTEN